MFERCTIIKLKKDRKNEVKKYMYTNFQREGQRKKDIFNLKHQSDLVNIDKNSNVKTATTKARKQENNGTASSRLIGKEINQLLCTQKVLELKDWNRPLRIRKLKSSDINNDRITEKGLIEEAENVKKETENKDKDLRGAQVAMFNEKSDCESVERTKQKLNQFPNCNAEECNSDDCIASVIPSCRSTHFLQICHGDKTINIQSDGFSNKRKENYGVNFYPATYCTSPEMSIQQPTIQGDEQFSPPQSLQSNSKIPSWLLQNHIKPSQQAYIVAMVPSGKVVFGQESNSSLEVKPSNECIGEETTRDFSFSSKRKMNNNDCNRETSISMKCLSDVIPIFDINNSPQRKLKDSKMLTDPEELCLHKGVCSNISFTFPMPSQNRIKDRQSIKKPTGNLTYTGMHGSIHQPVVPPWLFADDFDNGIGKRCTDTRVLGVRLCDVDENYPICNINDINYLGGLSNQQFPIQTRTVRCNANELRSFQPYKTEKHGLSEKNRKTGIEGNELIESQDISGCGREEHESSDQMQYPDLIVSVLINGTPTNSDCPSVELFRSGNHKESTNEASNVRLYREGSRDGEKENAENGQDDNNSISSDKSNIPDNLAQRYTQRGGHNTSTALRSNLCERNEASSLQSQITQGCMNVQKDSSHRETVQDLHESQLRNDKNKNDVSRGRNNPMKEIELNDSCKTGETSYLEGSGNRQLDLQTRTVGSHANEPRNFDLYKTEKHELSEKSPKTRIELIESLEIVGSGREERETSHQIHCPSLKASVLVNGTLINSDCSSAELFSSGKHIQSTNEASYARSYCDGSRDEEKENEKVCRQDNNSISSDNSNIPNFLAESYAQGRGQSTYTVLRLHQLKRNEASSLQSHAAEACMNVQKNSSHGETVKNLHESQLGIVKHDVPKANCSSVHVLRANSVIDECRIRGQLLQKCTTEVIGGDKQQVKEFLKAERDKKICSNCCGVISDRILQTCIKDGKLKYTKDINKRQRRGGFGIVSVCEAVYMTENGNLGYFRFIKKQIKRRHFNDAEVIFNMDYADTIPGLMHFYGVIIEDNTYISVLQEYFPGKTLSDFIKEPGHDVGLKDIIAIFYKVLHIINLLHCEEIVHWDIKGSNIMVYSSNACPDGFIVKLIDLGSAKDLRLLHQIQNFRNGTEINNPPEWNKIHMTPSMRNERILKARDTWCLGNVFYCLLTRESHILRHSMRRKEDFIATEGYRVYGQINTIDQSSDQGLPCAVHLLTLLLECEPYIRITVAEAIEHQLFTGQQPYKKLTIFFEGQVIFVKYFQERCWLVHDILKDKLFMDQIKKRIPESSLNRGYCLFDTKKRNVFSVKEETELTLVINKDYI